MKSLVAFSLVVAQLLGWSAAPMYLCVSDEGAICLDSGSGNCAGCDTACHVEGHAAGCAGDSHNTSCWGHHDEPMTNLTEVSVQGDGCGCLHLLVTWMQPPSVTSSEVGQNASMHAAVFDGGSALFVVDAAPVDAALDVARVGTPSPCAAERSPAAPTILRC